MTGNKWFRALPYIVIALIALAVIGAGYGVYEWVVG